MPSHAPAPASPVVRPLTSGTRNTPDAVPLCSGGKMSATTALPMVRALAMKQPWRALKVMSTAMLGAHMHTSVAARKPAMLTQ